ncbi:MAG: hypothetical protein MI725_06465 [Pirellulales bacterium]|nr:hypothetical protein [Pirellulales bacterium]
MTLNDLENAVTGLSADELARFRAWFIEFDADVWDRQLEEDVKAGKLDGLADEALRAHQAGKTKKL